MYRIILALLMYLLVQFKAYASPFMYPIRPNPTADMSTINLGLFIGIKSPPDGLLDITKAPPPTLHAEIAAQKLADEFSVYGNPMIMTSTTGWIGNSITTGDILSKINSTVDAISDNSILVSNYLLYIHGHGITVEEGLNKILIGTGPLGIGDYFITDRELRDYLGLLPEYVQKWVIIDACYSGGFIDELKSLQNIAVLTAAPHNDVTYYNDDPGIGLLSTALIDFFDRQGGAGFSFQDIGNSVKNYGDIYHDGMQVYESKLGDPAIFYKDKWNPIAYNSADTVTNPVPEPSTIFLFMSGVAIVICFLKLRKKTI